MPTNKRRSVTSSNEIEGIKIEKYREEDILLKHMDPETKEEYLLFGYNKALENIFQVYKYQSLSESYIKDLHYYLYDASDPSLSDYEKIQSETLILNRIVDLGMMNNFCDFGIVYANDR